MADEEKKFPAPEDETEMASPEEIEEAFDEVTPPRGEVTGGTQTMAEEFHQEEPTPLPETTLNLGHIRDRVAAGFIDLLLLGYLYLGSLAIYNYAVWHEIVRPIPLGTHGIIFHSIFGLLFFLYFFVFEGVAFTSPGKMLARLSVRDRLGSPASLFAVALRNLIRPIDYCLSLFPTWFLIEKLPNRQRLGDLLAGTVVMKHYAKSPQRLSITGYTASATLRILTGAFDLIWSSLWIGGILLCLDHEKPLLSLGLITLLPLFYLFWHLLWEGMFQTTFGFWIAGLKIVSEDGAPIGFTQAILRALFRLFDTNPIGWTALYLSQKNQRPSDLASATVVVHTKRSWNALVAVGISLALIGGVWIAGFDNPHSYLTPFFKIDYLKDLTAIRIGGLGRSSEPTVDKKKGLLVKNLDIGNREFKPGEKISFSFDVLGFTVRDREVWIQEDIIVRYPDHSIGLKQENYIDFRQHLRQPDQPLEFVNKLSLPADAKPGSYILVITLHDRLSDRHLTEQRTFRVSP